MFFVANLRSLNESDPWDVILLGAIGRVHPEDKGGLLPRIFSGYFAGTRPLKKLSNNLYVPVR